VSAGVSELTASTHYHFRAVAVNGTGTTYGPDATFSTIALPSAITHPATGVMLTSATLNGVVNPEGQATSYYFEWGQTTSYGNESPPEEAAVGSDLSEHQVEQNITGLTPDTTYHFRVVASNCGGCGEGTTFGPDQTFTSALPPTAITQPAEAIGQTTATLAGRVNPRGAVTGYDFEWGETTAYGARTPSFDAPVGSDNSEHVLTQALAGLHPGTLYHYRVVASNCEHCSAGTSYGADMSMITVSALLVPLVPGGNVAGNGFPSAGPAPAASLGRTALVQVSSGTVLVRMPGSRSLQPVRDGVIPMGSLVVADHGALTLTTAVDRQGHTESATLWSGTFVVSQTLTQSGMTTFTLAGGPSRACLRRPRGRPAVARASSHRQIRSLWARDNHGRFSTRGQNSVATVRGTYWVTVDRCDGTLTIVRSGAVSVRAFHARRAVLVRSGHSYLARP
jgi:hypothetical protein